MIPDDSSSFVRKFGLPGRELLRVDGRDLGERVVLMPYCQIRAR